MAQAVKRSNYGPAAGASGGATPRPARVLVPEFAVLYGVELNALLNVAGCAIGGQLYLALICHSDFSGPRKGWTDGLSYALLQSLLRVPKPERGQWAPPPSLKTIRTALEALEAAGLIHRDRSDNQAQGVLRLMLPHRANASKREREALRATKPAAPASKGMPAEIRKKLQEARDSLLRAQPIKGQGKRQGGRAT